MPQLWHGPQSSRHLGLWEGGTCSRPGPYASYATVVGIRSTLQSSTRTSLLYVLYWMHEYITRHTKCWESDWRFDAFSKFKWVWVINELVLERLERRPLPWQRDQVICVVRLCPDLYMPSSPVESTLFENDVIYTI